MDESFKVPQCSCPLCSHDIYDEYVENDLVHIPICVQCATQLEYLMNTEERLNSILLDKLESFTGITYEECKAQWHKGKREYMKEKPIDD